MKIICTNKEKDRAIKTFARSPICVFMNCPGIICEEDCPDCLEKNIEWEVTDEMPVSDGHNTSA